jgi:phytoene synthase
MDNYAEAAAVLRQRDRDRYLADLYAPAHLRRHLIALHAFAAEIGRIADTVSEPGLGEIRLQWWRDAIGAADPAGHPIGAALIDTVRAFRLPVSALDMLLAARAFDLYDDPMPTLDDLEGYAGETASAILQLSAIVLAEGEDPRSADAAGYAGVAETMVTVLRRLATDTRRAVKYVPGDLLAEHRVSREELAARETTPAVRSLFGKLRMVAEVQLREAAAAAGRLPHGIAPAFLPLAVAEARLDRMERHAGNPFAAGDLPAWRRQWILWRAARERPRLS